MPGDDAPPYLVTLGLDPASFARLDAWRSRYFPPVRNVVPTHVSLFHHLPGGEGDAVRDALTEAAAATGPIPLAFSGLLRLGRGIAVRVESPGLIDVHRRLARAFAPWLTSQDRQPFRPHVTVMNKAERGDVARAWDELHAAWSPWEGLGPSLRLWRYLGGPWRSVESFDFAGPGRSV